MTTSADYVEISMKSSNTSLTAAECWLKVSLGQLRLEESATYCYFFRIFRIQRIIDIAGSLDKIIQLTYTTQIKKYGQLQHEITRMCTVKSTTVRPIVVSATGNAHVRCLSQLKNLDVDRVLAAVQKVVLLITCLVVRSFLD